MKLLMVNHTRDRVPEKWLAKWVRALNRELSRRGHRGLGRRELVCAFVSSREMKKMNLQFRGKDYATDVLSFESMDPTSVGELVMCLPVIRRQAKRTGLSERGELGYMIVHGVLHLLGYDHETSAEDEAEMFALQDEIYRRLEKCVGLR
jgi:probable rRNA maturation factor